MRVPANETDAGFCSDINMVTVGLREGVRIRGFRIMGRVLDEAIEEILYWIVEGYEYSNDKREEGSNVWGNDMEWIERREMIDSWERGIQQFKRIGQSRKEMKMFMETRRAGFMPRTSGFSAPGAGGILWCYSRRIWERRWMTMRTTWKRTKWRRTCCRQ